MSRDCWVVLAAKVRDTNFVLAQGRHSIWKLALVQQTLDFPSRPCLPALLVLIVARYRLKCD